MIFSRTRKNKEEHKNHFIKSSRYYMYMKELDQIGYDLSEQTCVFRIQYAPIIRDRYLVLNIYAKPQIGLFQGIQFRPHIYLNLFDTFEPPKVLNDRKIYHPNIDFITGQILVPEIIVWNPTLKLTKHLMKLKYTLIEPNSETVPNNQLNIDAASAFILSRNTNYRQKIVENSPSTIESRVINMMENMIQEEEQEPNKKKKYLSFNEILPLHRSKTIVEEEEDEFQQITKRILVL